MQARHLSSSATLKLSKNNRKVASRRVDHLTVSCRLNRAEPIPKTMTDCRITSSGKLDCKCGVGKALGTCLTCGGLKSPNLLMPWSPVRISGIRNVGRAVH